MFGERIFCGEILHQLDDLEALPRSKLKKGLQEPQAFNRFGGRRSEPEVHFSREIEVFHLAPITRNGALGANLQALIENRMTETRHRRPPERHTEA